MLFIYVLRSRPNCSLEMNFKYEVPQRYKYSNSKEETKSWRNIELRFIEIRSINILHQILYQNIVDTILVQKRSS